MLHFVLDYDCLFSFVVHLSVCPMVFHYAMDCTHCRVDTIRALDETCGRYVKNRTAFVVHSTLLLYYYSRDSKLSFLLRPLVFYVSKLKPPTEEEREQKREQERQNRRELLGATIAENRIKKEKAAKLRDMKKYMFGKFITRVPVLKEDRYRDVPLPGSSATPYKHALLPLSEVAMQEAGYRKTRIPGQHLTGDMIPKLETDFAKTEAPIGQATACPKKVDKTGPGGAGIGATGVESTALAYAKIGSLLFCAAAISWFVVPLFANLTEKALQKM